MYIVLSANLQDNHQGESSYQRALWIWSRMDHNEMSNEKCSTQEEWCFRICLTDTWTNTGMWRVFRTLLRTKTKKINKVSLIGRVIYWLRTPALQAGDREFDSHLSHKQLWVWQYMIHVKDWKKKVVRTYSGEAKVRFLCGEWSKQYQMVEMGSSSLLRFATVITNLRK